jgi:hypothetical protein
MNFKPILFSTAMVQAIRAGQKTQTRRVIKIDDAPENWKISIAGTSIVRTEPYDAKLSRYAPGDILWVRETWCKHQEYYNNGANVFPEPHFIFKADGVKADKWRPAIFMPREAARIFLLVKDVRVERLQDITEEDARAEGVLWERARKINQLETSDSIYDNAKALFMRLWDNLNAKRGYGWDTNPWVWVISFERIESPGE